MTREKESMEKIKDLSMVISNLLNEEIANLNRPKEESIKKPNTDSVSIFKIDVEDMENLMNIFGGMYEEEESEEALDDPTELTMEEIDAFVAMMTGSEAEEEKVSTVTIKNHESSFKNNQTKEIIAISNHYISMIEIDKSTYGYVVIIPGTIKNDISIIEGSRDIRIEYSTFGKEQVFEFDKIEGSNIDNDTIIYIDGVLEFTTRTPVNTTIHKIN